MRALIIGIDSLIGRALGEKLTELGWKVWGTSRRITEKSGNIYPLDLNRLEWIEKLPPSDYLFLCAATTKYSECRMNPELSWKINVDAPLTLAHHFSTMGSHIIFLSSNAVFDGSIPFRPIDSPLSPITCYGRTKAEAEKLLMSSIAAVGILRLTKVFHPGDPLFSKWIFSLRTGNKIFPFDDMFMSPIRLDLVIDILLHIALANGTGVYQASASEDISYYDAGVYLARQIMVDMSLVARESGKEHMIPSEELPRFTTLESYRVAELLKGDFPEPPMRAVESILRLF